MKFTGIEISLDKKTLFRVGNYFIKSNGPDDITVYRVENISNTPLHTEIDIQSNKLVTINGDQVDIVTRSC